MRAQVKTWGNSAAVRIPASVMSAAALRVDQPVDIREENGRVIIEPIATPVFELDALLAQITPDNVHDEVEFGAPIGREAW